MAMTSEPLVSVIMCAYNAGPYLKGALESARNQSHRALEIMLMDDGSTDGSIESVDSIIRTDPRIRLFRQPNRGKPAAMNMALGLMKGEYYAIHDADDLASPLRVERQVASLQANPDVAAVFCGFDLIMDGVEMAPYCQEKGREECRRDIQEFRMPGHDPTAMYRRSFVQGIEYCEDLLVGQGFDYVLRVGEKYPMLRIPECLYSYRVHRGSMTRKDPRRRDRFITQVLKRACERRGLDCASVFPQGLPADRICNSDPSNGIGSHFVMSARTQRQQKRLGGALRTAMQAFAVCGPGAKEPWKTAAYALAPVALFPVLRRRSPTAQS